MRKSKAIFSAIVVFAVLVVPVRFFAYDTSPSDMQIAPEVIWAYATGGGTWQTEVQIYDRTGGSIVEVYFWYMNGGMNYRHVASLWTSPGIHCSAKFSNILYTMSLTDTSFTYFGSSGTLQFYTQDANHKIQVTAKTVNGNYGKTFPGLNWIDANSANVGREMMIQNLTNNAAYRTFVGIWNGTSGGWAMTVEFRLINANNGMIGSAFTKTIQPWNFIAFNPFVEAGVSAGSYDNVFLWINPTSSGNTAKGIFCYGSLTNNYTNDSNALFAVQYN